MKSEIAKTSVLGLVLGMLVFLSGCATDNRHLAKLEGLGGAAAGGIGAALLAKSVGANETIVIASGVLGTLMGHEAVKAAQWEDTGRPSSSTVVVVPSGVPYGYGAYGGHYDAYGRVYGAYGPSVYGYDPRYYRGWGTDGYCHGGDGRIIPCPGAYSVQPAVTVVNLPKSSSGPTVDNYRDNPMIYPDCKTGNYGADGKCLLRIAPALAGEQKICERDSKDPKCPQKYNAGKWAQIYRRLGGELIARQREQ